MVCRSPFSFAPLLGTASHIWLGKKSWDFVSWTKSAKRLGRVEAVSAETGGFSHVLGGLLARDMQKHYPDRQGTGEHPEFS